MISDTHFSRSHTCIKYSKTVYFIYLFIDLYLNLTLYTLTIYTYMYTHDIKEIFFISCSSVYGRILVARNSCPGVDSSDCQAIFCVYPSKMIDILEGINDYKRLWFDYHV